MRHLLFPIGAALPLFLAACTARTPEPEAGATAQPPGAEDVTEEPADGTPATTPLAPASVGEISKIHVADGVYLAAQPTPADFEAAAAAGIATVINVRTAGEITDFDEPAVVEGLGMAYHHLPIGSPDDATDELIDRAREVLSTAEPPILVHCKSSNRVNALWLPYRVLDEGVPYEQALAEAKQAGLRSEALEAKARDYIERHRE